MNRRSFVTSLFAGLAALFGIKVATPVYGESMLKEAFRQQWYVDALRRYNEAIALDYVIPSRVEDPILLKKANAVQLSKIQDMLNERRRDPQHWHVLPFPTKWEQLYGSS